MRGSPQPRRLRASRGTTADHIDRLHRLQQIKNTRMDPRMAGRAPTAASLSASLQIGGRKLAGGQFEVACVYFEINRELLSIPAYAGGIMRAVICSMNAAGVVLVSVIPDNKPRTIVTRDEKKFDYATITDKDADQITINNSSGTKTIQLENLPANIQKELGYKTHEQTRKELTDRAIMHAHI
jgi:hypothetical protein